MDCDVTEVDGSDPAISPGLIAPPNTGRKGNGNRIEYGIGTGYEATFHASFANTLQYESVWDNVTIVALELM